MTKIRPFIVAISAIAFSICSFSAQAVEVTEEGGRTQIRVSAGVLDGDAGEYVYDAYGLASGIPGYKVSQLNWQSEGVQMVGIGATVRVSDRLRLNLDHWTNRSDDGATMDDYDWLYIGLDWSHWSHHDNTTLLDTSINDVNAEYTLYQFKGGEMNISGMLGYRQERMKWESVGGFGVYSVFAYRDALVQFPYIPGITYEQRYDTPYIGFALNASGKAGDMPIVTRIGMRYSRWVSAEDLDIHHLRSLQFEESGDNGEWKSVDLNLDFYLTNNWSLNLMYSHQAYDEIKTPTVVTDLNTAAVTVYPGEAAGLDYSSSLVSVGMTYTF